MKPTIIIGLMALFLAGCQTTQPLPISKIEVVTPPESLYYCPVIKKEQIPDPETLTDAQVAKLLVRVYGNNVKCKHSMEALRKFILDAKARVEGK